MNALTMVSRSNRPLKTTPDHTWNSCPSVIGGLHLSMGFHENVPDTPIKVGLIFHTPFKSVLSGRRVSGAFSRKPMDTLVKNFVLCPHL
jgi:hypothetical protein